MKKALCLTIAAAVLLTLAACQAPAGEHSAPPDDPSGPPVQSSEPPLQSATPEEDPEIGVVFYVEGQQEVDGEVTAVTESRVCTWNVETGEFRFGQESSVTMQGTCERYFDMWDGAQRITTRRGGRVELLYRDPSFEVEVKAGMDEMGPLYGDRYQFSVEQDTCLLTLEDGSRFTFPNAPGPVFDGQQMDLVSSQRYILAGSYEGGLLTIAYFYVSPMNQHNSRMAYAKLNTADLSVQWSELIEVPEESIHGVLRFTEAEVSGIVGGKLYYSGAQALGCLDLNTGENIALTELYQLQDQLIPDTYRPATYGLLTQVMGYNSQVVVAYTDYRSNDDEMIYSVFSAIQGTELVGGFYTSGTFENTHSLTTFDGNLQTLRVYTAQEMGFTSNPAVDMEHHHFK